ncbi:MAG: oligoendopeptidase F [Lachnospiraceae bacterium]|nr:oligoendopeptidase F [Lachnospiraceae bacterium]
MAKELPERSAVKVEDTWDLSCMYENKEAWEKDIDKIFQLVDELKKYEGIVCENAKNLLVCGKLNDEIDMHIQRAYNYAAQLYDQDTADSEHLAMVSKIKTKYNEVMSKISFLASEISEGDEEEIYSWMDSDSELNLYRRDISLLFRDKPHRLSKEIEEILATSYDCTDVADEVYSVLDNADMEFGEIKDQDGELVRITQGRYISLVSSSDRRVREDAYKSYYASYQKYKNTYAGLYYGHLKSLKFYANTRKYDSTLHAALFGNEIPVSVYENLISAVNNNLDKLHRYVDLRKKCLGVDTFKMYDIYPPMVKDVKVQYSYEEAKALALEALKPLGEDYISHVKEAFENRWFDVYENKNKRSGAYSSTTYGVHPYMLLNYSGKLDDVFTLVHEMGHSMHSYYSNAKQPYVYSSYKIFVAEVASTCNEILLLKYMLTHKEDINERAYLLNHYMDMFKGTLFRQTQFAEFELETNRLVENGEALTADVLCKMYFDINKKYYGENVEYDDSISYEWERIPHFYYNYYVYQYSTSFCASVSIAEKLLNDPAYVGKYIDFLSSGCSDTAINLLKKVDIDMESSEPINTALNVMNSVMDEFEKLRGF